MKEQYTEVFSDEIQIIQADFLEESATEQDASVEMDVLKFDTIPEDSFQLYLQEIRTIPLLTAEEEVALAKQIANGDKEAKEHFIKSNLRLVVSIAYWYHRNTGLPMPDLTAEGNFGLFRAVDKFDWKKGYRFSTYATYWIRQAISRSMADQSRIIRVPAHLHELIGKINACRRKFLLEQGKEATAAELATMLNKEEAKVLEALNAAMDPLSLNTPVKSDEDNCYLMDLITDQHIQDPSQLTFEHQRSHILQEVLDSKLTTREIDVIKWRCGMTDGRVWTLEEIGEKLNLTRERIRQVEQKALRKLRKCDQLRELYMFCS